MLKEEKILVTGGDGLVGYSLKWGHAYGNGIPNAVFISSKDYDLRSSEQTKDMYEKYRPEIVIQIGRAHV